MKSLTTKLGMLFGAVALATTLGTATAAPASAQCYYHHHHRRYWNNAAYYPAPAYVNGYGNPYASPGLVRSVAWRLGL